MALPPLPWSQNKFFSTWINSSNSVSGTYGNVSLRVDGNTQLSNSTITALGVNKNSGATYALDVSGNSYSTNFFMDSSQPITQDGQLVCKKYADDNLASQTYVNNNFVSTVDKSRLMQSTTVVATANLNYYWNFGDPQLIVFTTNAGPVNIYLPNVSSSSNIGATFTIKKELQTMNAFAYTGFTYVNESNQALSSGVIAFSTVRVITFTSISTTGSQWAITYSQAPNFLTVCTLTNGQIFVSGAKTFDTNTTFSVSRSMTINAQATFNTVLPTTTLTSFTSSNQFITKGYGDATYAIGANYVDLTTNQSVGGIKTFTSPPVMSGASITAASIPISAVASGFVDTTTNQSVAGTKSFTGNVVVSGFLLPYHPAGTSSLRIGNNSMTGAVGASSLNLSYGNDSLNALTTGNYVIGLGHNQTCASNQNNTTLIGTNSVATTSKNNTVYFGGFNGAGTYQDLLPAFKSKIMANQYITTNDFVLSFETAENVFILDDGTITDIYLPADTILTKHLGAKFVITRGQNYGEITYQNLTIHTSIVDSFIMFPRNGITNEAQEFYEMGPNETSITIVVASTSLARNWSIVSQSQTATSSLTSFITDSPVAGDDFPLVYTDFTTGLHSLRTNSGSGFLVYTPSTGSLSLDGQMNATTFNGNLIGGTATKSTNLAGGLGGQIPYQSAVDTTLFLANGTAGQYLKSQGGTSAPMWDTPTSNVVISDDTTSTVLYPLMATGTGALPIKSNTNLKYNATTGRLESLKLLQSGLNGFGGRPSPVGGTLTLSFGDDEITILDSSPVVTVIQLPSTTANGLGARFTFIPRIGNRNYTITASGTELIWNFRTQYASSTLIANGLGPFSLVCTGTGNGNNCWSYLNYGSGMQSNAVNTIATNFNLNTAANLPVRDCYSVNNGSTAISITMPTIVLGQNLGQSITFRRTVAATATVSFASGDGVQLIYNNLSGATTLGLMTSTVYTIKLTALVVSGSTYAWFVV